MKVLFICTANVCRSPLAEGYFKHLLGSDSGPGIEVASAGVLAHAGSAAFDCAVEVARLNGFDLAPHKARRITLDMAHDVDMILCMETWQASRVLDLEQNLIGKTKLLGDFHPSRQRLLQIPDPRSFNVPDTLEVFQMIQDSVQGLHKNL
jgi:protein-tyrosine phosphatase